jgi:hypothetical protein
VLQLGPCLDVSGKLDVVAFIFGGGGNHDVVDVLSLVSYVLSLVDDDRRRRRRHHRSSSSS